MLHCLSVRALEWDGLEGSFGIFGLRASLVGMPNVPESEGTGAFAYYFPNSVTNFLNVIFVSVLSCGIIAYFHAFSFLAFTVVG